MTELLVAPPVGFERLDDIQLFSGTWERSATVPDSAGSVSV